MALPAPNLDDRRFQDLVDDAKRLVQQRCPEWTDHNVSDPGVTLIETFAYMTDQLLYRLNRVPDRIYVKFLDLIGVRLFPPTAARRPASRSGCRRHRPTTIIVPPGPRWRPRAPTGRAADLVHDAERARRSSPCRALLRRLDPDGRRRGAITPTRSSWPRSPCFSPQPVPDDVLLVGLRRAVPSCAVRLRLDCEIEGVGVDPEDPPLVWEACDGERWADCEVDHDDTGGLNRAGDIVLHVPAGHEASLIRPARAGWLRGPGHPTPTRGSPFYSDSPIDPRSRRPPIGGTDRRHPRRDRSRASCSASPRACPGSASRSPHGPVVPRRRAAACSRSSGDDGWEEWTRGRRTSPAAAPTTATSCSTAVVGRGRLGPAVRDATGACTSYGAVPPKGAVLRLRRVPHRRRPPRQRRQGRHRVC